MSPSGQTSAYSRYVAPHDRRYDVGGWALPRLFRPGTALDARIARLRCRCDRNGDGTGPEQTLYRPQPDGSAEPRCVEVADYTRVRSGGLPLDASHWGRGRPLLEVLPAACHSASNTRNRTHPFSQERVVMPVTTWTKPWAERRRPGKQFDAPVWNQPGRAGTNRDGNGQGREMPGPTGTRQLAGFRRRSTTPATSCQAG